MDHLFSLFFFFNDPATTEIYPLSLHDALPISTAGTVLDEELLTEPLRQQLTNEARSNVVRATGCKWDKDAHRPRRISLRPCDLRHDRQRGSARGWRQKISAAE